MACQPVFSGFAPLFYIHLEPSNEKLSGRFLGLANAQSRYYLSTFQLASVGRIYMVASIYIQPQSIGITYILGAQKGRFVVWSFRLQARLRALGCELDRSSPSLGVEGMGIS